MSFTKTAAVVAVAALGAAAVALAPCATLADDEAAILGRFFTEINASPAQAGETTILTFTVENLGGDPVRIKGALLPDGAPSRVMGLFGSVVRGEMDAARVDPETTERLDGDTAWIEVGPLAGLQTRQRRRGLLAARGLRSSSRGYGVPCAGLGKHSAYR